MKKCKPTCLHSGLEKNRKKTQRLTDSERPMKDIQQNYRRKNKYVAHEAKVKRANVFYGL